MTASLDYPINIDGHELAVLRGAETDGAPVVFVHGISQSVNIWPLLFPDGTLDSLNWCSISLPGHYPSRTPADFHVGDVTPELFVNTIARTIEAMFGDRKVHLAGWSTGGFAVLNLAASYPERFASVLSVAGYAQGRWTGLLGWLQTVAACGRVGRFACRRSFVRLGAQAYRFRSSMGLLASNRNAWRESRLRRPAMDAMFVDFSQHNKSVIAALFSGIRGFDITDHLSRITADTLIVHGDSDRIIPVKEARRLVDTIKPAQLHILQDCGHMFFAEATDQFATVFSEWLNRQLPTAEIADGNESDAPSGDEA